LPEALFTKTIIAVLLAAGEILAAQFPAQVSRENADRGAARDWCPFTASL
jgi:hypothetical protein